MPTPYEFDKYVHALMAMDWYYDYSDDHGVWKDGQRAMSILQEQAREHPVYQQALSAYSKCIYEGRNTPEAIAQRKSVIESIKASLTGETV